MLLGSDLWDKVEVKNVHTVLYTGSSRLRC
jgi:hypothetical protein